MNYLWILGKPVFCYNGRSMVKIFGKILPVAALLLLLVGLWPDARSLYDLTGEEALVGQVRGLGHWFYSAVRPQPQLAPEAVKELADVSPFGMNTFLSHEVLPEVREQSLAMLEEAGIGYIRQQFSWEDIEIHGKGDFVDRRNEADGVDAWAKYDNIVSLATDHNIEIIARLDNPPAWSRTLTDTIGTLAPPDNYEDYGDFVAAVVGRYQGQIRYFQLWNEPNTNAEWGNQPINPEAFTQLLCTGYRRAKAVNPEAVILAGALSPTISLNDQNLNDLVFLQRMYLAGAGDCFDGIRRRARPPAPTAHRSFRFEAARRFGFRLPQPGRSNSLPPLLHPRAGAKAGVGVKGAVAPSPR
jgi:hypothetical protein